MKMVVSGLHALHEAGIMHRDLKPSNLLMAEQNDECQIILADFGQARVFSLKQNTN